MKSLLRILEEMLALWLVCLLAGSSCAVFYTHSNNNDFPRLGRRSIFTASADEKDGVFPRIGRSSSSALSHADTAVSLYGDTSFQSPSHHKRGIFTAGGPGFPRIGRAQSKRSRSGQLSPAAVVTSVEGPDVDRAEAEEEETRFEYPLGLMFFEFDKDGDKSLSREEFVQGMARARQDGTLFR